jgi:DNA-binding phage protein
MALTRDFKETIVERVKRDPGFADALLQEALDALLNGEPEVARLMLRDLVNATIGFEELAGTLGKNPKSIHRMLAERGNPTMDNLAVILHTLRQHLTRKRKRKVAS